MRTRRHRLSGDERIGPVEGVAVDAMTRPQAIDEFVVACDLNAERTFGDPCGGAIGLDAAQKIGCSAHVRSYRVKIPQSSRVNFIRAWVGMGGYI